MTNDTSNNDTTINSYGAHVQEYMDGTPHEVSGYVKDWLDRSFEGVAKDARILEFGSAFGRDAAYLQDQGYKVACTDATPAFVDMLKAKGFEASTLNAITDELPAGLDVVLANAVLLHFTRPETEAVISKVYAALKPGGRFAFTLKQGEGEEWTDSKLGAPRFFCYWREGQIRSLLGDAGFDMVDVGSDRPTQNATWLHIIAKKAEA